MWISSSARRRLSRLGTALRRYGIRKTARLLYEAAIMEFDAEWIRRRRDRRFDSKHRVKTGGFLSLGDLVGLSTQQTKGSHNYRGTPVGLFQSALDEISIEYERFEFVDYGSGMGKALLLAARYPFRQITGVEFSPALHEIAEQNISSWYLPDQRCTSVRSVLADAVTWPLPQCDCLLYFFNPFREALMRDILTSTVASAENNQRTIYILYVHPSFPEIFDEFPQLKRMARVGLVKPLYDIFKVETISAE